MARILIIEDEPDIQALMRINLERDKHQVVVMANGVDGLLEAQRSPYDLILLDLMLPDRDGLDICRTLRSRPETARIPIIMVTAKGDESDVIVGLGMGADDYVTKPFRVKELMARVKARVARARSPGTGDDIPKQRVECGGLIIDPVRHQVLVDNATVGVTLTEFKLLYHLAMHPGIAYARYDLLDHIGNDGDIVTDRTVDVHVRNVRNKIAPYGDYIETVRGVGYRFVESATA